MKPVSSKSKAQTLPKGQKITRETIGTLFFTLERLPRFLSTILSIVGLIWFASFCFKLGWVARDNFILRPIAEVLFGLESSHSDDPSILDNFNDWLQD